MRIIPAPARPKPAQNARSGPVRRRETVPVPAEMRAKALAFDRDYREALAEAVAAAQTAESEVRATFAGHLGEEIGRLSEATVALAEADGRGSTAARTRVYRLAHRLRSTAQAFAAPLPARLAASLSRLLDRAGVGAPVALVVAHVDALRAAERRATRAEDPIARALAAELEAAVDKAVAKASARRHPAGARPETRR